MTVARRTGDPSAAGGGPTPDRKRYGRTARPARLGRRRLWLAALAAVVGLPLGAHVGYGVAYWLYNAPCPGDLPFRAGFETGDLSEWSGLGARQLCCAHSAVIVADPVRSGARALEVTLHSDDPPVKAGKRAELRRKGTFQAVRYRYAFSLFVPESWAAIPQQATFAQWHSVPDKLLGEASRGPPLRLAIRNGAFEMVGQWDADLISNGWLRQDDATHRRGQFRWSAPLERGRWIDWRLEVRWSPSVDGYVALWKDEARVYLRQGPVGYRDLFGPYLKIGLYVPRWQGSVAVERRSLYFDEVEIAPVAQPAVAER
jgi:hypothetical protein